MLVCSKCGEVLPDDIKFCPSCGTGTATAAKAEEAVEEKVEAAAPTVDDLIPAEPVVSDSSEQQQTGSSDNNGYTGAGAGAGAAGAAGAGAGTGNSGFNTNTYNGPDASITFIDAAKNYVFKIVDFQSQAGKKEFWFGFLCYAIVIAACWILGHIPYIGWTFHFVQLAGALATISMTVRRLRNLQLPWTRVFFYLIPVYGQIRFIIEMLQPTK